MSRLCKEVCKACQIEAHGEWTERDDERWAQNKAPCCFNVDDPIFKALVKCRLEFEQLIMGDDNEPIV